MIAVTGASGNLGKLTLAFLLKSTDPKHLIAIVRDPQKGKEFADAGVEVRVADYEDPESLNRALKGVDQLLQISAISIGEQGIREEANVVQAAIAQQVRHVVYTSGLKPGESAEFLAGQQCFHTENTIRESGMAYTFFRNGLYTETIPLFMANGLEDGNIYFPAGKTGVSFVSREEIAEALSNVLLGDGHQGQVYEITGPEAFSFGDIAGMLSEAQNREFSYTNIPDDILAEELMKGGMPDDLIGWYVSLARSIRKGEFAEVSDTLELLLNRKPQTPLEYLKNL